MRKEGQHWQESWTWNQGLDTGDGILIVSNIRTNYGDKKDCCKLITILLGSECFLIYKQEKDY